MSITVRDFKHIAGQNDAEYIKLLEEELEIQRELTSKAIAKLKSKVTEQTESVATNKTDQKTCETCRHYSEPWDSPKCRDCSSHHGYLYEPQRKTQI